jgi:hypothetical protein
MEDEQNWGPFHGTDINSEILHDPILTRLDLIRSMSSSQGQVRK